MKKLLLSVFAGGAALFSAAGCQMIPGKTTTGYYAGVGLYRPATSEGQAPVTVMTHAASNPMFTQDVSSQSSLNVAQAEQVQVVGRLGSRRLFGAADCVPAAAPADACAELNARMARVEALLRSQAPAAAGAQKMPQAQQQE